LREMTVGELPLSVEGRRIVAEEEEKETFWGHILREQLRKDLQRPEELRQRRVEIEEKGETAEERSRIAASKPGSRLLAARQGGSRKKVTRRGEMSPMVERGGLSEEPLGVRYWGVEKKRSWGGRDRRASREEACARIHDLSR